MAKTKKGSTTSGGRRTQTGQNLSGASNQRTTYATSGYNGSRQSASLRGGRTSGTVGNRANAMRWNAATQTMERTGYGVRNQSRMSRAVMNEWNNRGRGTQYISREQRIADARYAFRMH